MLRSELMDQKYASCSDYSYFCKEFACITGINLRKYKSRQMHRRLLNYMRRRSIQDFRVFVSYIKRDPIETNRLLEYLTINVTRFFRNPEQWKILKSHIIPLLSESTKHNFRVWSAGSAAGQEAYSAAMIFSDNSLTNVSIFGTDIDEPSLSKANQAVYTYDQVKDVPINFLKKYFIKQDSAYVVKDAVKRMVRFGKHDLLGSKYPDRMDLIICRNVLIYFSEESKRDVISKLSGSLKPGGVLFTGSTEAIFDLTKYNLSQIFPFFYWRTP